MSVREELSTQSSKFLYLVCLLLLCFLVLLLLLFLCVLFFKKDQHLVICISVTLLIPESNVAM